MASGGGAFAAAVAGGAAGGAVGGFSSGFLTTAFLTGDLGASLKAGIIGGVTGAVIGVATGAVAHGVGKGITAIKFAHDIKQPTASVILLPSVSVWSLSPIAIGGATSGFASGLVSLFNGFFIGGMTIGLSGDTPIRLMHNSAQDKKLSPDDISKLKRNGLDPELLKGGKSTGQTDLFKNPNGEIVIKPKTDQKVPGEPTGVNLKDLK